ncbi:hypothetical protein [Crateriforma spongiae]|uniref:hypothetical protein n=1 Tax=Crateriforma spongiae TaxID=2724528 RepID=UPI00197FC4A6|nr:hypothetical protein [Crateriforma spongiae]
MADNPNEQTAHGIAARIAFVTLVAASSALFIILAATWIEAWRSSALPTAEAWKHYEETGNGPWDHNRTMLSYVDFVFFAALMTLASGIATLVLIRTPAHRVFGGLASAGAVVTMWYHFLLID